MNKVIKKEIDLNGKKLSLETGKLATQADAAVVASLGETVVLATVATRPVVEDPGYFPLSVDYVEKYYAGGRITAQKFIKRETRPSEKAILSGRAIDRAIRPLFPKDFHNEVQIIITVLSFDGVNDPALVGFIGASAALTISSLPFLGPVGIVRIGERDGQLVSFPEMEDLDHLNMQLDVASTATKVAMVEAEAKQIPEETVFEAIKKAFDEAQTQINFINDFAKETSKEKIVVTPLSEEIDSQLLKEVNEFLHTRIKAEMGDMQNPWRDSNGEVIKKELAEKYPEQLTPLQISSLFEKAAKKVMNDIVINQGKRIDGRGMEEIRPISIETGILPRAHGSALFQRGESQVLGIATLGPLSLAQILEGMEGESQKRYMHHYNMSSNPFASGEVKRLGSPNRRDVGHGDLSERSLLGVLPSEEEFPYAMRVVSEVLGANASTSMASVCASTLSLLNAGVPLEPVAGIAVGLLSEHDENLTLEPNQKYQVITDMQAAEDFFGEMDFKVAGTKNGVTGIQMDTKLTGLTMEVVEEALRQAKNARIAILEKMNQVAPKPEEISQYAPKIVTTHIKPEEIGMLIGPGGKNINGIIAKTGAQIDIEDDGTVMISSTDQEAIDKALAAVEGMFKQVQKEEVYEGKVVRIAPFGAFVEILPGKDGLVHVSQMAPYRVEKPEDIVSEGQTVKVRVIDVDAQGKVALSMLFGDDIKPDEGRRGGGGSREGGGFSRGGNRGGGSRDFGPRREGGGFSGGGRGRYDDKRSPRSGGPNRNRRGFGK